MNHCISTRTKEDKVFEHISNVNLSLINLLTLLRALLTYLCEFDNVYDYGFHLL